MASSKQSSSSSAASVENPQIARINQRIFHLFAEFDGNEKPDIYTCMYHGGGSFDPRLSIETLAESSRGLLNEPTFTNDETRDIFPVTVRLVKPGRSARTDRESDLLTKRALVSILRNDDNAQRRKYAGQVQYNTRSGSGAFFRLNLGYRGSGEVLNAVVKGCNDLQHDEVGEVEISETRRGKRSAIVQDKTDIFGIDKYDPQTGFIKQDGTNGQPDLNNFLLTVTGNTRDVTNFQVAKQIYRARISQGMPPELAKRFVVMYLNCSPITDVSFGDSFNRASFQRVRVEKSNGIAPVRLIRQMHPSYQLLIALDILERYHVYRMGTSFKEMLQHEHMTTAASGRSAKSRRKTGQATVEAKSDGSSSSSSAAAPPSTYIEDAIGVTDSADRKYLYTIYGYFIKDYIDWIDIGKMSSSPVWESIKLKIETIFGVPILYDGSNYKNIIIAIMYLLLLLARLPEKYGGLYRRAVAEQDDSDDEEDPEIGNIWGNINKKIATFMANANGNTEKKRSSFRVGNTFEESKMVEAFTDLNIIFSNIEHIYARMKNSYDSTGKKGGYTDILLQIQRIMGHTVFQDEILRSQGLLGGRKKKRRKTRRKRKSRKRRKTRRKRHTKRRRKKRTPKRRRKKHN